MSRFPDLALGLAVAALLAGAAAAQDATTAAPAAAAQAAADAPNLTESGAAEVEQATDAAADAAPSAGAETASAPDPNASPVAAGPGAGKVLGLGRAALPQEVAAWDIDIRPDGLGLPDGQGSVADGEALFTDNCASCHGDFGEAVDRWPALAGGQGTLADEDPEKTVGSYWPYLSTTYDYIRRAMPFGNAHSLSNDEIYAITAYILNLNDLVDEDFVLSKANFLTVEMPNAGGFFQDDRDTVELPEFTQTPCMESCKAAAPEITKHATVLDVTPDTPDDAAEAPPPMQ